MKGESIKIFPPGEFKVITKIIYVGSQSNPVIRDQAEAFKNQIRGILITYIKQAIMSYNTTIANKLREAGYPELINLLEK